MSVTPETLNRINNLKQGIEAATGETYTDLTEGVQALKDGYGQGEAKEEQEKTVDITENGTVEVVPDEGKTLSKVTAIVNVASTGGDSDETIRAVVEGSKTEIILPNSVLKIGKYKFFYDVNLINIQCAGVTSIEESAFTRCASLALTELPAGVASIGKSAFNGCTSLALTELPAGVKYLPQDVFSGCTSLALTELPAEIVSIESGAFNGCTSLALTELPAGVTSIGKSAFSGCTSLALTELPAGVTGKLEGTFIGCTKNSIKTAPSAVTEITNSAFRQNGMTEFTVPANTKINGYRPFGECINLSKVTFLGKVTVTETAFYGCTNLNTINVPWAEGEVANAPWGATNATINYNYTGV